jgi:23S rRNA pseudouridine1911/1915/1917 synthase
MKAGFKVAADEAGETLAAVLRAHVEGLAWSKARTLCARGKVTVDGERVTDPTERMRAGQAVALDEAAPTPVKPARAPIVFEDAHIVIIDKPTGVSSVPYEKRETGTAMDLVRENWARQGAKKAKGTQNIPLLVVHRIDKDTSGLLAFAKTKLAERALGGLFRTHDVERTYVCVVHGMFSRTEVTIESNLVTDRGDGLRGSSKKPNLGKRAVTHVKVLERLPRATLCEVRLETGKTHQIRIHLSERGHPLVGERVYIRDYLAKEREPIPCPRLLLHAATLGFVHPLTKAQVRCESALPPDFVKELDKLRRH